MPFVHFLCGILSHAVSSSWHFFHLAFYSVVFFSTRRFIWWSFSQWRFPHRISSQWYFIRGVLSGIYR